MTSSLAPKRQTARTGLLPHTPWTQLMRSRGGDTVAQEAIGQIVGLYWRPIHVCVQKRGFDAHDAEDITQDFLSNIVQKASSSVSIPRRGNCAPTCSPR
jgi:hypothetical protein